MRPIRTLLFSTLYPSSARPGHGIFVETRLRELLKNERVHTQVVAPVPWFHSRDPRYGDHAAMARTPQRETRNGIEVRHPRYLVVPKVGMHLAPLLLALGARPAVQALLDEGFDFDLIDAHYFYPDGVAGALLARWFGKPLTITARGSDLNLIAQHPLPRRMMRWAAGQAAASVGVSAALSKRLLDIGAPGERVRMLRNGVDTVHFKPEPQEAARKRLGVRGFPVLLTVGNLLPVKRPELVIQALAQLRSTTHPAAHLYLVGAGPLRASMASLAREMGLSEAVIFVGTVAQAELPGWYSAADLLVLASSREGWPNVLLEAMACGTPVVASRVGGVEEVVCAPHLGLTVPMDSPDPLSNAIRRALDAGLDRRAVRQHALSMGWSSVSEGQMQLFSQVVAGEAAVHVVQLGSG